MDQQKQEYHDEKLVERAGGARLDKGWPAHHDLAAHEISFQRGAERHLEDMLGCDLHKKERAKSHRQFPPTTMNSEVKPSSLRADQSTAALCGRHLQATMLIPSCEHFSQHIRLALVSAAARPPVTTATVMELDPNWIFHNINLRSDINFENDLHFMPVKGRQAEQKSRQAQEYWSALAGELQIHLHTHIKCSPAYDRSGRSVHGSFSPRLPQMFADLRELLELLVPDRDHGTIVENLDVPFLMQQIENGVLDIVRLAKWLSSLLKTHCAPMRDRWADQMSQQVEEGSFKSDVVELVKGIERLFSVLEAMKLDVANYQIRTFRFHLMEDTISFQQRYWRQKIAEGKVDLWRCSQWYEEARRRYRSWLSPAKAVYTKTTTYESLIYGVISSLFAAFDVHALPKSFQFDLRRLERIRSDMEDLIYLRTGLMVFDKLRSHLKSGRPGPVSQDTYSQLRSRILAIVDEQPDQQDAWQISSADVALEIARAACEFSESPEAAVPDQLISMTHLSWRQFASAETPECQLLWTSSLEELTSRTGHHAQVFNGMAPVAMAESQQQWPRRRRRQQQQQGQNVDLLPLPDLEDVARRLAHVTILHWKVWANLAYLNQSAIGVCSNMHAEQGAAEVSNIVASVEMLIE